GFSHRTAFGPLASHTRTLNNRTTPLGVRRLVAAFRYRPNIQSNAAISGSLIDSGPNLSMPPRERRLPAPFQSADVPEAVATVRRFSLAKEYSIHSTLPPFFLSSQKFLFPLDAPSVPCKMSVLSHHPMAGNNNGHRVSSASPSHRPNRTRSTYAGSQIRI